jgi:hypothetical protein
MKKQRATNPRGGGVKRPAGHNPATNPSRVAKKSKVATAVSADSLPPPAVVKGNAAENKNF